MATLTARSRLPLLQLVWLNDIAPAALTHYGSYYHVAGLCFLAYLTSLGLRSFYGEDKPALTWLRQR